MGSTIAAVVGLGFDGEQGMEGAAAAGAEAAEDGIQVFDDEDAWDVIGEIPDDSAAALLLLEHHWAVPLRDAIASAGGFRISDGFISPLDLVEIGLLAREEVDVHALDRPRSKAWLSMNSPHTTGRQPRRGRRDRRAYPDDVR